MTRVSYESFNVDMTHSFGDLNKHLSVPRKTYSKSRLIKFFKRKAKYIASGCMCTFTIVNSIIFSVLLLSYSTSVVENFNIVSFTLSYISTNIVKPPITDIQIITDDRLACPPNYENIPIGVWPGTVSGCYCISTGALYDEDCGSIEDGGNCINYNRFASYPLYNWKSRRFCAKRSSSYLLVTSASCPEGYKPCSANMCYKKNEDCPITTITVVKNSSAQPPSGATTFTDGSYLIYNRDKTKPPLTALTTSINGQPCLNPLQYPYNSSNPPYGLLNIDKGGCGMFGVDKETQYLDNEPETRIYQDNGLQGLINFLPGYTVNISMNIVYLYSVSRLKTNISDSCIDLDLERYAFVKDKLEAVALILAVTSVLGIFVNLAFFLRLCIALSNENGKFKTFSKLIKNNSQFKLIFLVVFLFMVGIWNVVKHFNENFIVERQYFRYLGELNCFENMEVSDAILDFEGRMGSVTEDAVFLVGLVVWFSVLSLVVSLFGLSYKFVYRNCL